MKRNFLLFQPSIFPLSVAIFFFLKKKEKGFPLQSGLFINLFEFFKLLEQSLSTSYQTTKSQLQ